MQTDFVPSLARVLNSEGGYVNNPHDPGGATNRGITQAVYNAFRKARGLAPASVKFIAMRDVTDIYRFQYWDQVRADDLPAGVDYAIFDEAVLSGVVASIKDLQAALGHGLKVDGHIGILTLTVLGGVNDHAALVDAICDRRLNWMHRLKTWRFFGKGWKARVERVRADAHRIAARAAAPAAQAAA